MHLDVKLITKKISKQNNIFIECISFSFYQILSLPLQIGSNTIIMEAFAVTTYLISNGGWLVLGNVNLSRLIDSFQAIAKYQHRQFEVKLHIS